MHPCSFNGSKSEKGSKKAAENSKAEEKLMQKIGHPTVQVDWLKKNLKKCSDLTGRKKVWL